MKSRFESDDWKEDWYKYTEIEKELTDLEYEEYERQEYERRCAEIQKDITEMENKINKMVDTRRNISKDNLENEMRSFLEEHTIYELLEIVQCCVRQKEEDYLNIYE